MLTPVELIFDLHNLTGLPVLDCLSAIRDIPPLEWGQFLERVKADPSLIAFPPKPPIARKAD